jgi:maleylacetoacetate isomerase
MALRLHTYWRSSAAYRVRIVLACKDLPYESVPRHLLRDGGEQRRRDYLALNPQGLVPALEHDGFVVAQSLAICEYLEECFPEPPLLPAGPRERALVRAMGLAIACDIHPLNNLRVQQYLRDATGQDEAAISRWVRHWIAEGLGALETLVGRHSGDGRYCFGASVTLADACLVPQLYNARRAGLDLAPWPRLAAVASHLESLSAFVAAHPEVQPDAPPGGG